MIASLMVSTCIIKIIEQYHVFGNMLNIFMDICIGQNKNKSVLWLVVWLVEMSYFKQVNLNFKLPYCNCMLHHYHYFVLSLNWK